MRSFQYFAIQRQRRLYFLKCASNKKTTRKLQRIKGLPAQSFTPKIVFSPRRVTSLPQFPGRGKNRIRELQLLDETLKTCN